MTLTERIKLSKENRSSVLRKLKALIKKAQRIQLGEEAEISLEKMLVEIDEYWELFRQEHLQLEYLLGELEAKSPGTSEESGKVSSMNMAQYYANAKEVYRVAYKDIVAFLTKEKEEKDLRLLQKKRYAMKQAIQRDLKCAKAAFNNVGAAYWEHPEQVRSFQSQEEVVKIRIHINTGIKCLNSAEVNLVDAFALEDEGIADFIQTSTKEVEELLERVQPLVAFLDPYAEEGKYQIDSREGGLADTTLNTSSHRGAQAKVKFKPLEFPNFSGKRKDFAHFQSIWKNIVENSGFSKFVLANQLLSSCKGGFAHDLIKSVDIDSVEAYDKMWVRLTEYYGDTGALLSSLYRDLERLKPVTTESVKDLIHFCNELEYIVQSLSSISPQHVEKVPVNIVDKLAKSIPQRLQQEWHRVYFRLSSIEKERPLNNFVSFMNEERSISMRFWETEEKPTRTKTGTFTTGVKTVKKAQCWLDKAHSGHWTRHCFKWKRMSPEDRRTSCLKNKRCIICLENYQKGHECSVPASVIEKYHCQECSVQHRGDIACKQRYIGKASQKQQPRDNEESTDSTVGYVQQLSSYPARYDAQVLGVKHCVPLMTDDGSDLSFVNQQFAEEEGLKKVGNKTLHVKTISGVQTVRSGLYEIPLVTREGVSPIICYSTPNNLTGKTAAVDIKRIQKIFPSYKPISKLSRSTEPAKILLGLDNLEFHPNNVIRREGKLAIKRGQLGDVLVGSLGGEDMGGTECSSYYVSRYKKASAFERFIEGEEIGVSVLPRCGNCKCGHCPQMGSMYNFQEEKELSLIRSGLTFRENDNGTGRWFCKCPWIKDPGTLPDNKYVALATLRSTEKSLERENFRSVYTDQIEEMKQKGVCKKLDKKDELEWQGPKFYICHLAVKSKSVTTPVRICFNSSQSCKGTSLNDMMATGPTAYMNCLISVLIRWREYPGVILGDISKMYYAIGLEPGEDQQTHRFLWRESPGAEVETYIMTALSMGDTFSPVAAMEALYQTGNRVKDTQKEVSYVLKKSSYVDDLVHSTTQDPVTLAREVHTVLNEHGFIVKEWQFCGEGTGRDVSTLYCDKPPSEAKQKLFKGENGVVKVLGINWSPVEDKILYSAELNFSPKKRGIRTEEDVKEENFWDKIPAVLTRRIVLEQTGRIFDPLGLIGPHVLKAKMLLRQCWEEHLGWDDPLPESLSEKWKCWLRGSYKLKEIEFPRCTKPETAIGDPWLVIFTDGSLWASGSVAYVRWKTSEDQYQSQIILARNRIAPKDRITVPRLELNGAVLGVRIRKTLMESCRYTFERIIHIVDSEIVLNQVTSLATKLEVYEGTRVGECQRICNGQMEDWFWIPGKENIGDWNTRGKEPLDLNSDSMWQKGPEFLTKHINEWPIRSVDEIRLPIEKKIECNAIGNIHNSWLCYTRVSKWDTLVRALAMVIGCIRNKKFRPITLTAEIMETARRVIIKDVQKQLMPELDINKPETSTKSRYKALSPVLSSEGIWCVGGRSREKCNLPNLIPANHAVALILMNRAHKMSRHAGSYSTLCKFREEYYVVRGSKLAQRIRNRCTLCRLIDKQTLSQKMGKIPLNLLQEAPVFTFIQVDIFGPWKVRGEVQKRTTGKCYGVLFVCLNSKAVHIEFIAGYSTDDFLLGLQRFAAIRGWPSVIYSDPGSQLMAADKELKEMWNSMNQEQIRQKTLLHKTDWIFSPADSPHRQGVVEALIKSVKRSIKTIYNHDLRLSWQEYVTLGHQVSDLMNSRPIGILEDGDPLTVLTPNALILGRNSSDNPGNWSQNSSCPRLSMVNMIIQRFWEAWMKVIKPALLSEKKWHSTSRNIQEGDIVLIIEDSLTKQYKLGQIHETITSADGIVRSVKVRYKNYQSGNQNKEKTTYSAGTNIVVTRSVQKLCLIVPVDEECTHHNDY